MIININGKTIEVSDKNVSIRGNKIFIDGKPIDHDISESVHIIIQGDVGDIECTGSVEVQGNSGNIKCGGSCTVDGNVVGDIDAGGSVNCRNVFGNIDAGGSVRYKK